MPAQGKKLRQRQPKPTTYAGPHGKMGKSAWPPRTWGTRKGGRAVERTCPAGPERSRTMDEVREFLSALKRHGYAQGNFLGLLHVCIGRRVQKTDGTLVCSGLTWRDLA